MQLTTGEGLAVVSNPSVNVALGVVRPRTGLTGGVGNGHVGRGDGDEGEGQATGKSCKLHDD